MTDNDTPTAPDGDEAGLTGEPKGLPRITPAEAYVAALAIHDRFGYYTDADLQMLRDAAIRMQEWNDPCGVFLMVDREDGWTREELLMLSGWADKWNDRAMEIAMKEFTDGPWPHEL